MREDVYAIAQPEALNVSSHAIRTTIHDIRTRQRLPLHSFLMLRKGWLLWEEYFRPDEANRLHVLHSISKAFTATAYGNAQAQGLLHVEERLFSFFPEMVAMLDDPRKDRIRLRHLLMMGSGYANNEQQIFAGSAGRYLPAALAQPMVAEPGTLFNYYTLGTYLLSAVFSRVVDEGLHAYLKRKLFGPMQITRSVWDRDAQGIPMGGTGLHLTAYDLSKLGQLTLNMGLWEGQQLVPAQWIQEATRKQIDNSSVDDREDWQAGYGYQFWRNSFGGFRAAGMNGQYIVILPEQESVIVMTSHIKDMNIPLLSIRTHLLPGIN